MSFKPDYRHIAAAATNKRPSRPPIYEHFISPKIMEQILDERFAELIEGNQADLEQFFKQYCRFFKEMGYDTISFEVCITSILPDGGAIVGGKQGPIQSRADFEAYPWDDLSRCYWETADRQFEMLRKCLPDGMKAIGGVGNGVFETSEDLVGLEYLAYMRVDDPQLFADLYRRIGELMVDIWSRFLRIYAGDFAVCRFGDDLGFKTATLLSPDDIRKNIIPQYKRVIELVHSFDKPFLLHCCGNVFTVMDDLIETAEIDAKHSNEDVIAPFSTWVDKYGNRIGNFGGIDVDVLCRNDADEIKSYTREVIDYCDGHGGVAFGSGNSIPDYVPVERYLAMVNAVREYRGDF